MIINIIGPGLLVNGPALIVLQALRECGFNVECEDWAGLNQWQVGQEITPPIAEHIIKHNDIDIKVVVKPQPWGG